jgi:AraC-like DNA-binding protein
VWEVRETVIKAIGDASQPAQSDSRLRTTSPEQAIHMCKTAFYPHRLKLVGPSKNFGFTQRVTCIGPITLADVTYETDVALSFDQPRASYHVNVPLSGWFESRHRGVDIRVTPEAASVFGPDGETTVSRWPGGTRNLAVKIDRAAVDGALEVLIGGPVRSPIPFNATLKLQAGATHDWVRLLLMVHRQLDGPDSLLRHPVVWDPLVESLIHGLLLVADHPYRQKLFAPADPGRPAAVRDAMDIIDAGPHLPLTTSTLARQCHVSVRTLQEGFQRHLGISPMAYLRLVRLRRAHRDLRSADPSHSTVASIAHHWGFTHLGSFAAAHKQMYGETPRQALRAVR